jgi:hypothetical protein
MHALRRQAATRAKPGLDRAAFMDLYKPAYDREITRAKLSPSLRAELEALEGHASARKALHAAENKRIERENTYYSIQNLQQAR